MMKRSTKIMRETAAAMLPWLTGGRLEVGE
jgi:hypothetical protein